MSDFEISTPTMYRDGNLVLEPFDTALRGIARHFCFDPDPGSSSYLGKGGFATVYRGEKAGCPVAVKVFSTEMANRPFLREVAAWNRLRGIARHPCFPEVLEVGWSEGGALAFLVMSLVSDQTYLDRMARNARHHLSRRDRLAVLARILHGLAHLAGHNLIHRDIKPNNITVGVQPMILDLGLLVSVDDFIHLKSEDLIADGTPRYMAPECFDPSSIPTPKSDVFSVGIVLAESFGARILGSEKKEIREFRLQGASGVTEVDFASRFTNPSVAHALQLILAEMLHPDPEKRMTAADACYELSAIVAEIDRENPS